MTLAALLIGLVGLTVVALVAWPLTHPRPDRGEGPERDPERVALDDAIDRSLRAIREIEFDHRAGNLSDEDFASLDRDERRRAAELLRRRDALSSRRNDTSG